MSNETITKCINEFFRLRDELNINLENYKVFEIEAMVDKFINLANSLKNEETEEHLTLFFEKIANMTPKSCLSWIKDRNNRSKFLHKKFWKYWEKVKRPTKYVNDVKMLKLIANKLVNFEMTENEFIKKCTKIWLNREENKLEWKDEK